jgi:hypothetical protein
MMTDNDHNAFVSMYEGMECDNPFDEGLAWDWDDESDYDGDW